MAAHNITAKVEDYRDVAGPDVIEELRVVADQVRGRRMQHINSTPQGGGVAEILLRLVPLLSDLGLEVSWDVIKGNDAFFSVTKAFHNALHGSPETITAEMLDCYRQISEMNLAQMRFTGDYIWIHDPQPAGLIAARKAAGRRWVWRCHIDLSSPNTDVWDFLRPYVEQYDASVFSMPEFAQRLSVPQFMITPSIDPLSEKNRELDPATVRQTLEQYGIDPGRPVLTQVSRFDRLKDPLGVMAAYRMVRKRRDCQLVLAGGAADDDPEGLAVLDEVRKAAGGDPDIHVLLLPVFSDRQINALVRGSTIVFQKSIKEGFGLTVSEALWKRKPVIGGAVGGIKIQIVHGFTGFLVHSPEGAAQRALQLLDDPDLRSRMGENGYQHVKQNFLVTRHLKDYMLMMLALEHPGEDVVHLA